MNQKKKIPNQLSNKPNSLLLCILLGGFLLLAGGYFLFFSQNGSMAGLAEKQLRMVSEGKLDAAYEQFFSQGYKKTHSLQQFKQFVASQPILKNNDQSSFYNVQEDQDKGEITGVIRDRQKGSVPLLFSFVKEDGDWKISALQIFSYGAARTSRGEELSDAEMQGIEPIKPEMIVEMVQVIESYLKDLREGKIEDSYQNLTTEAFKKATSYAAFVDFLKQYPELQGHTAVSFLDQGIKDGRGMIRANLIYQDGVYPVDFIVIKEEGKWKIWSLKTHPADVSSQIDEKEKKELTLLVGKNMALIKKGHIERAYDNSHRDFKEATQLEDYKEFLSNFPELSIHQEIIFGEAKEQGPLATMPVIFVTENGSSNFNFWFRQDQGEWKILGMNVEQSSSYPPADEQEKQELNAMIKEQLKALKEGDYSQAYYGFAAADFEKSTSLQAFKEFVSSYPIFREFQNMEIQDAVKEGELRLVKVSLASLKEQAEVDYRFSLEGKKWKVWGIQIMTNPIEAPAYQNDKELIKIINDQMSAVRLGDISKAYYAFTSPDFQETSNRDVFATFMQSPIFKNNSRVGAPKVEFKDTLAVILTELESDQGEKKSVEYKFSYIQGRWKIAAIRVIEDLTPKQVTQKLRQSKMNFSKILIGTETNAQGIVTKNNTIFKPTDKEITVNLQVSQGIAGATIQMLLEHLDSGSKIPPIDAVLKNDSDAMVTFVFSPPPQGWPVGTYKLHATSSTGLEANYSFVVQQEKAPPPANEKANPIPK